MHLCKLTAYYKTRMASQGNTSEDLISRLARRADRLQQKHPAFSFPFAVIKKYGDDQAGQQAALLTYYGFLSLFPLLLVATSVADLLAQHNNHLRARLLNDATSYFPVVGDQLQQNIHGSQETGLALVAGLLVAIYGARGIANAVRNVLDNSWGTPRSRRSSFWVGLLRSMGLLFGAGLGLLLTTILAGYATAQLGHSLLFRLVPIVINAILLYLICMYVFIVGPSRRRKRQDVRLGAIATVVGLLILQTVGGYLITHELHRTSGAYGQFALVLAIMFWIYLLAQVLTYSIEINVVHTHQLWPRSLTGKHLTPADERADKLLGEV